MAECERQGVGAFCWITRSFTAWQARQLAEPFRACILEAEIPATHVVDGNVLPYPQAQNWLEVADAFRDYGRDCAVATSFAPFQRWAWTTPGGEQMPELRLLPAPDLAKPLIDDGWYCLPYVYPAESPGDSIPAKLAYAQHYGPEWANAEPVLGCYGGFTLDDFPERNGCVGYSIWDAGEVIP